MSLLSIATAMPAPLGPLSSPAAALTGADRVVVVRGGDIRVKLGAPIAVGTVTITLGAMVALWVPDIGMGIMITALGSLIWGLEQRAEHPEVTRISITLEVGRGMFHVDEDGAEHRVPLGLASIVLERFDGMTIPLLRLGLRTWKITGSHAMSADDVVELLTKLGVSRRGTSAT